MKFALLLFLVLSNIFVGFSQARSSVTSIVTVFSENGRYSLTSIPFDEEYPSLRGTTSVFDVAESKLLYRFERGFDSVEKDGNNLILSNDGKVAFFLLPWGADEFKDGLKSVSIYKEGRLAISYSGDQITGCNSSKERCDVLYNNWEQVIDKEKSNWGTPNYRRTFKDSATDEEKFLNEFPLFSSNDFVYIIDSRKQVHRIRLEDGTLLANEEFDKDFQRLKSIARHTRIELRRMNVPMYFKISKLQNGTSTDSALAKSLGMKIYDDSNVKHEKYKKYMFKISGYVFRDGSFKTENLEIYGDLPKATIREFFASNRFDLVEVPKEFDKWFVEDQWFTFRKASDSLARKERATEIKEEREELRRRLTAVTINGRYVPANLGESFVELDKLLPEIDRKEMHDLKTRQDMIRYHHGLGMWMRNNWGLWGGSRLQKYFSDKGMTHPEDMSSVILFFYWDWLKGNKNAAMEWERDPKQKIF